MPRKSSTSAWLKTPHASTMPLYTSIGHAGEADCLEHHAEEDINESVVEADLHKHRAHDKLFEHPPETDQRVHHAEEEHREHTPKPTAWSTTPKKTSTST